LNDLELPKLGVFVILGYDTHLRANCAKSTNNKGR